MKIPFIDWLFVKVPSEAEWEGKLPPGFNDLLLQVPPENRDLVHKQAINEAKLQWAMSTGTVGVNIGRVLGLGAAGFLLLLWLGGPALLSLIRNQITN
jgi:hypothetical protein